MNNSQKLCSFLIAAALIFFRVGNTQAGSATWKVNPDSGDWNSANNWSAGGPPNGPNDTAFFGMSNLTDLFLTGNTEVNGITYNAGASAFTITNLAFILTISGVGITNNSGVMQNFVVENHSNGALIRFVHSATAGNFTTFTNRGGAAMNMLGGVAEFHDSATADRGNFISEGGIVAGALGGLTSFRDSASAANGVFVANGAATANAGGGHIEFFNASSASSGTFTANAGAATNAVGGAILFMDNSSADQGSFTANGATIANAFGGQILFQHSATAANGVFTNNGGLATIFGGGSGRTIFTDTSSAGNATLIANGSASGGDGGSIVFLGNSTGDTARVEVFGNGNLDLQFHTSPGITIGSLEGDGHVLLNANQLTIGSNNLSTVFSGVIENPPIPRGADFGGSLVKIGNGTLILSGANTYTGSTTVNNGKLIVNGSIRSPVTVNGGSLGGSGTIAGVTVNKGGTLAPGDSPGILNVAGNLVLSLGSTYLVDLNGTAVGTEYDQTHVIGNVRLGGATLSLNLGFVPNPGMMFTIINNDLSDVVTEMFNGLPDSATFSADGQFFTITYHGGDGNDVVLNVVPEPQTWILVIAGLIALCIARKRIFIRNSD